MNINNSTLITNISMICAWTPNCMLKYNDNIFLVWNYTFENGIYIVDIQNYSIIKQIEGFQNANTIINKFNNDNLVLVDEI